MRNNVTPQDRADLWEVVAKKREERGDLPGAARAHEVAEVNREGWLPHQPYQKRSYSRW